MNFLNLEYFIIITEEGSYSKAAGKLFVSQQSLGEHVKKLEAELGTPLFRRGRTLSLTEAGEAFLEGSREILAARDRMLKEIASATDQQKTKINIGVATYDSPSYLPEILTRFIEQYPQYEPVVIKRQMNGVENYMEGIDLLFAWMPLNEFLKHEIIKEDSFVAVVNKKVMSDFYGSRYGDVEKEILLTQDLSVLKEMKFIFLYDRNGAVARDQSIILRNYDLHPAVGFKSENADLNFEMCLHGAGVMISTMEQISRKLNRGNDNFGNKVNIYRIKTPGIQAVVALSYDPNKKLKAVEKQFIDVVREYFDEV